MPHKHTTAQTCSICIQTIANAGKIDSCKHLFCYQCINKWSQKENKCPLCKQRFSLIQQISIKATKTAKHKKIRKNSLKISQTNQNQEKNEFEQNFEMLFRNIETRQMESRFLSFYMELEELIKE